MIFEHIGLKAAQKFTNLREAFRFVDADKDGCVNRGEVRYFFRAYDLPETVADRFFDRLAQGARSIDYLDFVRCMTPAIECGQPPSRDSDSQVSTREPSPRRAAAAVDRQHAFEEEFRDVMEQIRMKAVQRLGHARELKRFVAARDGYVSRSELQHLFRAFCISQKTADAFFDRLAEMGSGDVEYEALMHWICPLLKDLPGVEGLQPQSEAAANLYVMPLWASSASADTERSGSSARSNTSSPIPTDELYYANQHEAVRKNAERWGQMQAEVWADELRMLVKSIREKLPLKFKHAREAFRPLDVSRDGKVTPTEMRSFVRGFGWSHEVADRLFALLDTERRGEIEYGEFVRHFEEMLDSPLPCAHSATPHSVTTWNKSMDPKLRRAVNDIACLIGDRLVTKYNNAREAFRHLDLTNDGWLTRTELRRFCRSMNFYGSEADMLFDALGGPAAVQIRMDAFVGMLESFASEVDTASSGARMLSGGDRWRVVEELRDLPRPGFSHT
jgi:Ca2+-binding EF-hand superfamily protein